MRFFLCGLPNVGKTTTGVLAAKHLKLPFFDLDQKVEELFFIKNRFAKSCRQIFLDEGEDSFRKWESKGIETFRKFDRALIALGGGSLERKKAQELVISLGSLIYLRSNLEPIFSRIEGDMPAFLDKEDPWGSFLKMATRRDKIFKQYSRHIIDVDVFTPDQVANKIIEVMCGQ